MKATKLPIKVIGMPKLNGIRIRWNVLHQCFFTNSGIMVGSMDHVVEDMRKTTYLKHLPCDGEAYNHDAYMNGLPFQKINGLARRHKSSAETEILKFNIFDFAEFDNALTPKDKRLSMLKHLFEGVEPGVTSNLVCVPYADLRPEEIAEYNRQVLAQGYEGIMICDPVCSYTEGKGKWMYKWKPEYDEEFTFVELVPATEGRNLATFASMRLRMADGNTFCCAGFTDDEREELVKNPPNPGAQVTICFGDKSADGVPIFPRYKCLRWDQ